MKSSRDRIRVNSEWVYFLLIWMMWTCGGGLASAFAQTITTTITPSGLGTTVTTNATTTDITGGTRPGNGPNLFHSFGEFSIGNGDTANFYNETNLPTTNILSRVTGGNVSNIFGTLKTTNFGSAALWLINPSGIVFGPNASLDVGGAVHFSTADYLKFTDGAQFFSSLSKASTLTSVPVEAFGFLGPTPPKAIDVRGAILSVPTGESLSLIGGNTGLTDPETGATPPGVTITGGRLTAPGGQINLVSVGTPSAPTGGEVPIVKTLIDETMPLATFWVADSPKGFSTKGDIALINTNLNGSGGPPGNVTVMGGQVMLDASQIEGKILQFRNIDSLTVDGTTGASDITVAQGGELTFDTIESFKVVDGRTFNPDEDTATHANIGGSSSFINFFDYDIRFIRVGNLTVDHGAISGTNIYFTDIGDITVLGTSRAGRSFGSGGLEGQVSPVVNGSISSGSLNCCGGIAGNIDFTNVESISLQGGLVSTTTETDSNAGAISFQGIGRMAVNGVITSNTGNPDTFLNPNGSLGSGDAGTVSLTDVGTLTIAPSGQISSRTKGGSGNAGTLIFTDIGVLTNRGRISASSTSLNPAAAAGDIRFDGIGMLTVDGGQINSRTLGNGPAGTIMLSNVHALTVQNSGVIRTNTTAPGHAGNISISTTGEGIGTFEPTSLQARTAFQHALTAGGVSSNSVTLKNGGSVESKSALATGNTEEDTPMGGDFETFRNDPGQLGNAGTISLTTSDLTMSEDSQMASSTEGAGAGGAITLNVETFTAQGETTISTNTTGTGSAGNVTIQGKGGLGTRAAEVVLHEESQVVSDTAGSGQGGNVVVLAETVFLGGDAEIASDVNMGASGDGGTVTIEARTITLQGNPEISTDTEVGSSGSGGQVTLEADEAIRLHITAELPDASEEAEDPEDSGQAAKAGVFTNAEGTGDAGTLLITTPLLEMDGGVITARTEGPGTGGNVEIHVVDLKLAHGAAITAESSSDAADAGGGGAIVVQATDSIQLIGGKVLATVANGSQPGGDISLSAGQAISLTHSQISVQSEGLGNAGDISLTSATDIFLIDSEIQTTAAKASGGNIKLTAPDLVLLDHSKITSSVNGPVGSNGGNIGIDPEFVVLANNSQILAQAFGGNGGNINIVTNTFFADSTTLIDASSQLGISGTITINSPVQNLAGTIAPLPKNFTNLANLYAQRCAANKGGQFSSFVQGARDALPPQPGEALGSPMPPVPVSQAGEGIIPQALRLGLPEWVASPVAQQMVLRDGCPSS